MSSRKTGKFHAGVMFIHNLFDLVMMCDLKMFLKDENEVGYTRLDVLSTCENRKTFKVSFKCPEN